MAATGSTIFISYSHKDRKLFDEFNTMLAPAVRRGLLDPWHDQKLLPGSLWKDEIEQALAAAQVAVLLVSQNFLASHFIADHELAPLLEAARQKGLIIFWIYLSACMYGQTEIASYQAAHEIARPLDRLSKPERQGVLSEVCARLLKIVDASSSPQTSSKEVKFPAPASGAPARHPECCVLLIEALRQAERAARGGGPTTTLHRQAGLAKQWLEKGTRLLPESRGSYSSGLANALEQASRQTIPSLIGWSLSLLAEAGAVDERKSSDRDSHEYKTVKHEAYLLGNEIDGYLKDDAELAALEGGDQKWALLGFRDKGDFKDYLYPSVRRVAQNPDPMQRDLLERLVATPEFTISELHREGYRKDIVMDSVNALLAEKWAEWVDLTLPAEGAKARMTGVGVRLLSQLLKGGQTHPAV